MNAAAGWLLIFCAVLISGDIFAREVLRASIGATLEISSYILAVSIAWGLAHALSERQHVRIDLIVTRAPMIVPQGLWATGIVDFVVFVTVLLAEVLLAIILGRPRDVEQLMGSRTLDEEAKEALEAAGEMPASSR